MNKHVELPLIEPLYKTYHSQGAATAIIGNNPTIRNWYLNHVMNLSCNRKFLDGFTSPEIKIKNSSWKFSPCLNRIWISTQYTKGYINPIIRELLDDGYYVNFRGVDDYYVKGKTWYKERHFSHDGLICGYDQNDKSYCIYAYDSNWIYNKFWISQKDFNAGRIAMRKRGIFTNMCALKPKEDKIDFLPETACLNIKGYLDPNFEKDPDDNEERVYGIVVHEYIAEYVSKLYNGDIPYERMDRRVFRLIWEHKKVMFERIELIEQNMGMNNEISTKYKNLVSEADTIRMLYASHHMKRRDSVLPIIKKKLLNLMNNERKLLTLLIEKTGEEFENEIVELSEK